MALQDVLVHTAVPVSRVDGRTAGSMLSPQTVLSPTYALGETEWIEGEPGSAAAGPVEGTPFPCVLFLPTGSEDAGGPRSRRVSRPTLLYAPRPDGSMPDVGANDELEITAPELAFLTGGETVRWQIDGEPQPFGPPGEVIGVQATLLQVMD